MTESFAEYRTRVLGYLDSCDPVGVLGVTSVGCFKALRFANLALLRSLPPASWDACYGTHATRGRQSVSGLRHSRSRHDLSHLRQIRARMSTTALDSASVAS